MRRGARVVKRICLILTCLLLVAAITFGIYTSVYYKSDTEAQSLLQQNGVWETETYIACGNTEAEVGYIFYPGAKVDAAAYLPYLLETAQNNTVFCAVVKPVFRLAILGPQRGGDVMDAHPDIAHWVLGGHSLGGVVAASQAASHPGAVEGLVLLASYPAADLAATGLQVLCITATQDKILNWNSYAEAQAKLPPGTEYVLIEGGNHSQFGSYGFQRGDGQAGIGQAEQRAQAARATQSFLLSLGA